MAAEKIAKQIVKRLQDHGYVAYFAGGAVRDMVMDHPFDDIDIATSAKVCDVQKIFPKTIPVGIAFGIVIVVHEDHHFEVATFRTESEYLDGRRPSQIQLASEEEDAKRRDFTINGMFYDPIQDKIIDYVGGKEDIARKVIRAIGDPHHRFLEDRLRMIRAVRYSARFNFPIEKNTYQAIVAHAKDLFPSVAIERVWQEFVKICKFPHVDTALITLHELGLLSRIFVELKEVSLSEIARRVCHLPKFPPHTPALAYILPLFPDKSLADKLHLAEYLKLSKGEKAFIEQHHEIFQVSQLPPSWEEKITRWQWTKLYSLSFADLCLQLAEATVEDPKSYHERTTRRKHELAPFISRHKNKDPLIKAEDLIQLGIEKGPHLGKLLAQAEEIAANENLTTKQDVLKRLLP